MVAPRIEAPQATDAGRETGASPAADFSKDRLRSRQLLALAIGLTLIALWPILRGEFVYDDLVIVKRNPLITSFANVPRQFSGALWDFLEPGDVSRVGYWRPLASVVLTAANTLGGGEPLAFHVVSLLLHLAATAVAFRFALRWTKSLSVAFFASLIFGLHPVHVESVAWISAINDPLFGWLSLMSLDAFLDWRGRGSPGVAWTPAVFVFLALLSKELAVATLLAAVAIDVGRDAGGEPSPSARFQPLKRAYGPFVVAVLAWYLARAAVFGGWRAGFDLTTTDFGVSANRLFLLRFELLGGFLGLLTWPAKLNLFHPFTPELATGDLTFLFGLACIAVLCVLIWAWHARKLHGALGAALLIPAALAPLLLRVESLGTFPLSERFLYVAVMGFALLVAIAALRWLPRTIAFVVLGAIAISLGWRAHERAHVWRDEESLFAQTAKDSPRVPYVQWGYGRVLLQKYRQDRKLASLNAALEAFQHGLDLLDSAQKGNATIFATREDYLQANIGFGWSLLYEAEIDEYHDYETPLEVFKKITDRYPDSENAFTALGVAALSAQRLEDAELAFGRALVLNPKYVEAHHNLGLLRMRKGEWKAAAKAFEDALRYRPDHLDDLLWLTRARVQGGDDTRARDVLARASQRYPREAGPMVLQGTLAAQKGDFDGALRFAKQALERDPDDGEALLLEGKVHLGRGENAAAQRAILRAAELLPTSFEAHYNAAALLLKSAGPAPAMPYLQRAYELRPLNASGAVLRDTLAQIEIGDADTLWDLASADAARSLDDSAFDWVERALALKPDHGPSHFLKGHVLKRRGDIEGAIAEWKRACEVMKESYQAQSELGMLLVQKERAKEALPYLERALEIATKAEAGHKESEQALGALRETLEKVRAKAK